MCLLTPRTHFPFGFACAVFAGCAAVSSISGCTTLDILGVRGEGESGVGGMIGDPVDEEFPNLIEERTSIPLSQVNAKVNDAFLQLFFGDPVTEAVFFDQGDGTGYIEDIANGEVRLDAMGYGMMVTVQLDQREVFDKLWSWAKTHMLVVSGPSTGLLGWNCDTIGNCTEVAATDSSSVVATSLLIAQSRWAGGGQHDYQADAIALLASMVDIETRNGGVVDGVVNCFDVERALPRAGSTNPDESTPADYLMPAFYEIWAQRDPVRQALWTDMAKNSRQLLELVAHPTTGLIPEEVTFDGQPVDGTSDYRATTHRTLLNLALDFIWNGPKDWIVEHNERRLDFFLAQGVDTYVSEYTILGEPLTIFNTAAHRSLVALSAGTTTDAKYDVFLEALLDEAIPTGEFRYYDGMIYMLSLLALSGQMTPN